MIKNEREYHTTKEQLAKFESALAKQHEPSQKLNPEFREIMIAAIQSQMEDLKDELAEYERKMNRKWKTGALRNPVKFLKTLLR